MVSIGGHRHRDWLRRPFVPNRWRQPQLPLASPGRPTARRGRRSSSMWPRDRGLGFVSTTLPRLGSPGPRSRPPSAASRQIPVGIASVRHVWRAWRRPAGGSAMARARDASADVPRRSQEPPGSTEIGHRPRDSAHLRFVQPERAHPQHSTGHPRFVRCRHTPTDHFGGRSWDEAQEPGRRPAARCRRPRSHGSLLRRFRRVLWTTQLCRQSQRPRGGRSRGLTQGPRGGQQRPTLVAAACACATVYPSPAEDESCSVSPWHENDDVCK